MAQTHFNELSVWMNLKNYDELTFLMREVFGNKSIVNWKIRQIQEIDDPKLGKRIHIVLRRPNYPGQSKYLWGHEYQEWERIKSHVYAYRRKKSKAP